MLEIFPTAFAQNNMMKDLLVKEKAALESCKNIVSACQAAGYYQGGVASGKGLAENCVNPILSGQTVAGVTVNNADLLACQALKAKMMNQQQKQK